MARPASSEAVARVFVGCAANNEDLESQVVLEYSLRKHASIPVEITWMQLSKDQKSPFYSDGTSGWQTQDWATPFSGFRWAVPELAKFDGRALYTDSDVIFLADVAELWQQYMPPGKIVLARGGGSWRFCVSLWSCSEVTGHIPPIRKLHDRHAHRQMIHYFRAARVVQPFLGSWNYCDNEDFHSMASAKAVHYTDMSTQPQLRYALPRLEKEGAKHWYDGPVRRHPRQEVVDLFEETFVEACESGYTIENYRVQGFGEYKKATMKNYAGGRR